MNVSIVITCWNGKKLLEKNLSLVFRASENPKNKIEEVLVVDDESTDDSAEYIKSFKDAKFQSFKVKLVEHGKNLGYSAACNTGVKEAKGELVAIFNLDVIPSEKFLEAVLPHFDDEKVFSVSFNEGKFGPGKLIWKNGFLEIVPNSSANEVSLTDWPSGGSSIFRKKIWEQLGGMDELFSPFYFEDIDLGLRACKAGYKCLWEPEAKVIHQHEATINPQNIPKSFIDSIKQRNQLLLTWRNIENIFMFFEHLFYLFLRCIVHPGYSRIVFLALKRRIAF